jgi:hypothetical protein
MKPPTRAFAQAPCDWDFLCFAIYSASRAFNVYQPLLRDLGLTYPQFIALAL